MATDDKSPAADTGCAVELPAPYGWKKKFTPKKHSRRNDIVFVSPTGDEIRSKSQMDKYLKSHRGGPSASEFDWSTGETPRRSGRISEKVKAIEASESEPSPKRSSTKKGSRAMKENTNIENEDLGDNEDALVEKGNKKSEEVEKSKGGEATENNAQDAVVEEAMQPIPEETIADDSKKEQVDDHVDIPIEEITEGGEATENNAQDAVVEEAMQPVPEETIADDSTKEQAGDHVDIQIEEITDGGTENRSVEPEATPENEGGEVGAGLDVNEDDSRAKVETQPPENAQSEINVAENTLAESNSVLSGDDTVPENGFSDDAPN